MGSTMYHFTLNREK